ncbi:MAG: hypothetical protein IT518_23765 [Burkholderiales bacterium]|nr:hypothetical protein [Burkholderiales bacterium]
MARRKNARKASRDSGAPEVAVPGTSDREVPAKDPRFADAAWRDNPFYKRIGQSY